MLVTLQQRVEVGAERLKDETEVTLEEERVEEGDEMCLVDIVRLRGGGFEMRTGR